jgi:hypothetical protein
MKYVFVVTSLKFESYDVIDKVLGVFHKKREAEEFVTKLQGKESITHTSHFYIDKRRLN